jgi:hypothetical protein
MKYFDDQKGSCKHKFSSQFKEILFEHGKAYSKKDEGGKYLGYLNPQKIADQDEFAKKACLQLQSLDQK